MARGDGDGWVACGDGQRRWGRYGAAGLLLRAPGPDPRDPLVLLQLRVGWSHHGGTWGLPGGARDSTETPVQAALREAAEETSIDPVAVAVRGSVVDDLGGDPSGWSYTTVVADVPEPLATVVDRESDALEWVPESAVAGLPLHPGLSVSWPGLRAVPTVLVLDSANVVGSVPDGWWRDRVGATGRVLSELTAATPRTVEVRGGGHGRFGWVAEVVAVVEGAARAVVDVPGVRMVRASGSGDDAIVEAVTGLLARAGVGTGGGATAGGGMSGGGTGAVLVASADRGLLARLPAGVATLGPGSVRAWS